HQAAGVRRDPGSQLQPLLPRPVSARVYVRRLAKAGVRLVSITQELGDDPMSNMIRQIMALFDEYQSKENGKHTLRAMKENARQGFWNGSRPPIGYPTRFFPHTLTVPADP